MITPAEQLDRRFQELKPWLALTTRPPHGWVKAIRQALGMTTGQMAKRIKVAQTRVSELERAEEHGSITLKSLERAAQALDCRVVYLLVPNRPLSDTLSDRAHALAEHRLAAVERTMQLEDQAVSDSENRKKAIQQLAEDLLRKPGRLWDQV